MPFFTLHLSITYYLQLIGRKQVLKTLVLLTLFISSNAVLADIQPRGSNQSYAQKSLSNAGNPAAAALTVKRKEKHIPIGGSIEFGGGVEYGDFDELFAKIDELSLLFKPPTDADNGTDQPPAGEEQPPSEEPPSLGEQWDSYLQEHAELEDRLDIIKHKVEVTVGLFAFMKAEGYAKAEVTNDMSFVLNDDLFGGTLLFGTSFKGNSKAVGIFDEINLDLEQAREELRKIPQFTEKDKIQALTLSEGVILFYNPLNQEAKMVYDNDSLLLVKATKTLDFSISYSRNLIESDSGDLYLGIKPILHRVGLTNVSKRLGDITDTEKLFDDIQYADYIYENGFDTDLGIVWAANNYQVGASLTSIFEHTYDFPELEEQKLSSLIISTQLSEHEIYKMERQLKLEAGIYTDQRHWSLDVELDANAISDPMGDDYQWFSLTGGYTSNNWLLSSARLGFSRNLAGTSLGFINAGVTFLKYINLDAATTIDTVMLDGNELRRGANIRLGVQFSY